MVIKYGGNAMTDPALQRAFAEDVVLLKLVGINPGGDTAVGRRLNRAQAPGRRKATSSKAMRVTDAETMGVVEWVLAGEVQTRHCGPDQPTPAARPWA